MEKENKKYDIMQFCPYEEKMKSISVYIMEGHLK